jgi:hypothetical protein
MALDVLCLVVSMQKDGKQPCLKEEPELAAMAFAFVMDC